MKPEQKNGEIIFESKLGYMERYFNNDPKPKYIFHDTMHGGKVRSGWNLRDLRSYVKQLRKFYKEEIKRNRHSPVGLKGCSVATEEINRLEKKINYIEKRHKAHMDEINKHRKEKEKKQQEWEEKMAIIRAEKKEKKRKNKK